jgi:restriction system protein
MVPSYDKVGEYGVPYTSASYGMFQRMARRRRTGVLEDLFDLTSRLPWWVGVVLAVFAYMVLHHYATLEIPRPANSRDVGAIVGSQIVKSIAMVGQYLLPFVFGLGGLLSFIHSLKNPTNVNRTLKTEDGAAFKPHAPATHERSNLFELWKSVGKEERAMPLPPGWSLDFLNSIDWKRFEEVCAAYFRLEGFNAETQARGPDGGVDIRLYAKDDGTKLNSIVQCKQYTRRIVGPKSLRELRGVMPENCVEQGIVVTSSRFNTEARRFASENHIELIDGELLLQKILACSAADQAHLLAVATEGEYLVPTCPTCGVKMVERKNRKNESPFWGCRNYPDCRFTLKR